MKLICVFVFAYAKCWFSHDAAQLPSAMIFCCFQDSYIQNACLQHEDHIPQVNCLGFDDVNGTPVSDTGKQDSMKERLQSFIRCIQTIIHACQCTDANCKLPKCLTMKTVMTHTKSCRKKADSSCPTCKQLIAICCYHAKHCYEYKCKVPYCKQIKYKLQQHRFQDLQLRRFQDLVNENKMKNND